jgi:iron complex outermembrane receptor protein
MGANATTGALLTNPTTGALIPALGREGTLTAFYGNPRQIFVTATVNF